MAPTTFSGSDERPKQPHISEQPITMSNWYRHVSWVNVIFVAGIPLTGLFVAFSTPLLWKTAVWAFLYYFMTGLGITAGAAIYLIFVSTKANESRLSQTMVSHVIFCHTSSSDLSCCRGRRSRPRLYSLVVPQPSCTSPIYRHSEGPILCPERYPILSHGLDGIEAKPSDDWPSGCF